LITGWIGGGDGVVPVIEVTAANTAVALLAPLGKAPSDDRSTGRPYAPHPIQVTHVRVMAVVRVR
jgi:hypothetical protein